MTDNIRSRLTAAVSDRYTIERELGGGGMSRVFVALEHALGRRVVIKTLPEDATFGGASAERFRLEILTAARIEHANIVPVLAAGDIEGTPYFVMPWVDGDSLRQVLLRGRVPLTQAVFILRDVARALAAAHAHGVVHRDIKPENILCAGGAARVTDFGVAKALSAATQPNANSATNVGMTGLGTSIGTPAYMAPEQLAADPALDHRADIYAWGLVAYEVLSGHYPFEGLSGAGLMKAQLGADPQPLSSREPSLSPSVASLVMKALSKDPAQRPQSANELIDALDESSTVSSGESYRGTSTNTSHSSASRSLPAAAFRNGASAVAVFVLAAGAMFGVWKFTRGAVKGDERVIAVAPFKVSGATQSVHYLREGVADLMVPQLASINGIRPSSSRQMFDSWKRAAKSMDVDLPEDQARNLARSIGAGQIILGEITGNEQSLTITAHLSRVGDSTGSAGIATASVAGIPDSLVAMTAQLTTRLILGRDHASPERMRTVMSAKPAAITSFLNGERFYRSGRYSDALKQFAASYAADSTFPLVPLRISTVNGWVPEEAINGPWIQRAQAYRQKLTGADSMFLEANADPAFPAGTPPIDNLKRVWNIALRANSAEIWYLAADNYMHNGAAVGVTNALELALDGFKRAEAIDSSYVGGIEHQSLLYLALDDTANARAADQRQARIDSTGDYYLVSNAQLRIALAKPAELPKIAHDIAQGAVELAAEIAVSQTIATVLPLPLGMTVVDSLLVSKKALSSLVPGTFAAQGVHDLFLNTGRIAEAQRNFVSDTTPLSWAHSVLEALYWDADSVTAAIAFERIARWQKVNRDTTGTVANNLPRLAFALWSVERGDTAVARQVLNEFRAYRAPASNVSLGYPLKIYGKLLASRLAVNAHAPEAKRLIADLDSVLVATPRLERRDVRSLANLMIAGLYDEVGDAKASLRVSKRRDMQLAIPAYASTFLRVRANAAEKTGDFEEAIRSLRTYIELRAKADPALQSDVQAAKDRLKALEKKS
ncbi:MAG: serine/threonine-protein kinase [Gemmatimonas sp.]